MAVDRRGAMGVSESIRQQRRELLEMSQQQARNFSEVKREIQPDPPPIQIQTPKEELKMGLPHLVIVGADKGGVGKTVVARTVLDYFKAQGVEARAIDTQMPEGNLKRFHPDVTEVIDLSSSDGQIKVFDALPSSPVTVIDIQAGLLTPTLTLLSEIGLLAMVEDGKMNVTVMHVVGSTVQSLSEIEGAAKILTGSRHFIVKNHTNDAAFFAGLNVSTDALKIGTALIDIPKLDERATEYVEAAATSFANYAKTGDSFTMRGKVGFWEKGVFAQYDAAKLHIV
ncbi:P-loop NTPase family protein [Bradyrhizobium diazoefficiens]|uniref:CobQ/CobB/MinD/ParA nucleotide binding domain-containing protein n=3 Tax=Bradyrhizobium TaxID=374 RepID=A0A809X7G5_9BRAD|nr:hypothetical protein XF1B_48590 [Bradyrhizobium diazoefficiens]BCE48443.1 hypothetical protein XF4B_47920 [Bradyrhizobium diazoefficiens]BCE91959.1 hypothetical protein XF10B_47570 [Bradyrhizobium diazoefficiens]BCF26887.1 hypothetical protein XF14B_48390 [Bradyrhizobium diazoefficiens]